jgi:hypothetical protein
MHAEMQIEIVDDLRNKLVRYNEKILQHKKMLLIYRTCYYLFGSIQVLAAVVCSALSAALSAIDPTDKMSVGIFVLSLTSAILAAINNFFNLESNINKHHNSKIQYSDLSKDIQVFLLHKSDETKLLETEMVIVEKEKFISAYEPSVSLCWDNS